MLTRLFYCLLSIFLFTGKPTPQNLVDILIQESFYDMAFVVILKFWKGSELKRYR